MAPRDPAHHVHAGQRRVRGARVQGAQRRRRRRPRLAAPGAQRILGPARHVGPARRHRSLRTHPHHERRPAGRQRARQPGRAAAADQRVADPRGGPSCQKALEGSGFVVGPERVMTNAHVVAGTSTVSVDTENGPLDARVVVFDPAVDVAILDVPGLRAAPLSFAPKQARTGDDAIVLGYPGGGPYTASAARIREVLDLRGPDIYRSGTVEREVYTVRGSIRQGNSGGPLVDEQGRVLGVVFGAAVDDSDTGFVLTANEVSKQLEQANGSTAAVGTGVCIV
ncbi:MarP family serine protease [Prescottella defluvii]|nr:MarP family serine protease [Prescottella defluvii]